MTKQYERMLAHRYAISIIRDSAIGIIVVVSCALAGFLLLVVLGL